MIKTKKLLSLLLCVVLAFAFAPLHAFAAEEYALWVNGERFTSDKLEIACGEGKAEFDPATNTLTLTNAAVTSCANGYGIVSQFSTKLTVAVKGENSINIPSGGGIVISKTEMYAES